MRAALAILSRNNSCQAQHLVSTPEHLMALFTVAEQYWAGPAQLGAKVTHDASALCSI
jgi:hypothetical protein